MNAIYCRVSSKSQTLDMQRAAIERCAQARGDTLDRVYEERLSGKTLKRPELDRLRADARAGHIKRLYVYRLDRLTRSGIRDTFELVEELKACGVELITVSDGFSLEGPASDVILAVMSWAAKMERIAINERISAARTRLEAEGRRWGRPSRLNVSEAEKATLLRSEGLSVRAIAARLNIPRSTIARSLKNTPPSQNPGLKIAQ